MHALYLCHFSNYNKGMAGKGTGSPCTKAILELQNHFNIAYKTPLLPVRTVENMEKGQKTYIDDFCNFFNVKHGKWRFKANHDK